MRREGTDTMRKFLEASDVLNRNSQFAATPIAIKSMNSDRAAPIARPQNARTALTLQT